MDCTRAARFLCFLALLFAPLGALVGCASGLALVGHAMGLSDIPPEYAGLKDSRVAVVCVASSSATKGSIDASRIAENVEQGLRSRVPGVKIIGQSEIENWKDANDWDQFDFRHVGRGVKADKVLAIDLKSYSLHGSQSLYKGSAEVDIKVYDIKSGEVAFQSSPSAMVFPRESAIATTEMSESDFRRKYCAYLSSQITRHFVTREVHENFAEDITYLK